tara:strand:+ start:704 stop:1678 length:975 start_codon:yes stop_codon:yes gene_type:complete
MINLNKEIKINHFKNYLLKNISKEEKDRFILNFIDKCIRNNDMEALLFIISEVNLLNDCKYNNKKNNHQYLIDNFTNLIDDKINLCSNQNDEYRPVLFPIFIAKNYFNFYLDEDLYINTDDLNNDYIKFSNKLFDLDDIFVKKNYIGYKKINNKIANNKETRTFSKKPEKDFGVLFIIAHIKIRKEKAKHNIEKEVVSLIKNEKIKECIINKVNLEKYNIEKTDVFIHNPFVFSVNNISEKINNLYEESLIKNIFSSIDKTNNIEIRFHHRDNFIVLKEINNIGKPISVFDISFSNPIDAEKKFRLMISLMNQKNIKYNIERVD